MSRKVLGLDRKIEILENHLEICRGYLAAFRSHDSATLSDLEIEVFKILQAANCFSKFMHHTTATIRPIILEMEKRKLI